ncbi:MULTISPECIES: TerD family protein [Pseudomonas]|jgi:tellurium resistance protein TerZ|uniref:Stress protein n=1 Tax=Pseudomonas weihenstephanensis TaxID=1608994 RepID=A0A0J6IIW8_9PSED|nr:MULTISPECIES: TerD family protein [Pseudomonas]KMN12117.1 stress protein [Pseudomonas weihenstephanensis]KMN16317.1 stress protein [Pseudomonas weihenstephanensis]KVV06468.1 Stress response protein SCP2 [Pseudomonas sp. TAD18]KVV07994.1 Stress response protein SCP2 [Pseudomonas sp. TAA207]MBM1193153.1 TerD family protein [Pseudomonas weihenstephanensis]
MAISLSKNQTISLEKEAGTGLKKIRMGLGWDPVKPSGFFAKLLNSDTAIDLDASCIVLDSSKQLLDLVWFRELKSKDGSIVHSGDNRTGEGDGDDESIQVNLEQLPSGVKHLVFTVNSFTGQNFESVENAYCRIVDEVTGKELARFNLSDKGRHTGVVMAYLSRTAAGWDLTAIGTVANGRTAQDLANEAAQAVRA